MYYNARQEVFTFTSTLGVGSIYVSEALDISQFQNISILTNIASSDFTLAIDQSGYENTPSDINTPWDIRSTVDIAIGSQVETFVAVGKFGRMAITSVNSSVDDVMRIFAYGVPV